MVRIATDVCGAGAGGLSNPAQEKRTLELAAIGAPSTTMSVPNTSEALLGSPPQGSAKEQGDPKPPELEAVMPGCITG